MTSAHDMAPGTLRTPIPAAATLEDELRAPRERIRLLTIPEHRFVMIDGEGPPAGAPIQARMPGLYGVAYGLRFALKRRGVIARVGPLEGLWWTADGTHSLDAILLDDRGSWRWTLMLALPDDATTSEIEERLDAARQKLEPELAGALRVEPFDEGPVAQVLHIGAYADERPTIDRLHEQITAAGLRLRGRHHELYLSDPRRSAPARLRTILRQPVA